MELNEFMLLYNVVVKVGDHVDKSRMTSPSSSELSISSLSDGKDWNPVVVVTREILS